MGLFLILLITLPLLLIVYFYLQERRNRIVFESKGVPYLGNGTIRIIKNVFKGIGIHDDLINQYRLAKSNRSKLIGATDFGTQTVLISDPELIKQVLVKDFDHFVDRRKFVVLENDTIMQKMIFGMTGERWKALRSKLSPTFTTGKIKRLFSLFNASGKKLVKYVEQEMDGKNEINLEEGYSKFAMDVIASAVCGMDAKTFGSEMSVFEKMGKKMQFQVGGKAFFKFIVMVIAPWAADLLGWTFFQTEVKEFFSAAIKSSIKDRETNKGQNRDDFIQLMLEARTGKLKTDESELDNFEKDAQLKDVKLSPSELLDDDGIVANAVLFILAGYDTTQSLLVFMAYVLAIHQDVQEKLRKEIEDALEESGGDFTYESLNNLNYLDMVINETLRLYPPAAALDRNCTHDYKIPGTDFVLKKDQAIAIITMGLHRDEAYFPNPDSFDPERFSPENKNKINPYTFLPFGQGPRNCIGMRFALTEVKVAIGHLVHNFKLEPSKKTLIPMEFAKTSTTKPKGGMHLALHKIHH